MVDLLGHKPIADPRATSYLCHLQHLSSDNFPQFISSPAHKKDRTFLCSCLLCRNQHGFGGNHIHFKWKFISFLDNKNFGIFSVGSFLDFPKIIHFVYQCYIFISFVWKKYDEYSFTNQQKNENMIEHAKNTQDIPRVPNFG
jgi:hypothetical protein